MSDEDDADCAFSMRKGVKGCAKSPNIFTKFLISLRGGKWMGDFVPLFLKVDLLYWCLTDLRFIFWTFNFNWLKIKTIVRLVFE
jgi:hypothetical protein